MTNLELSVWIPAFITLVLTIYSFRVDSALIRGLRNLFLFLGLLWSVSQLFHMDSLIDTLENWVESEAGYDEYGEGIKELDDSSEEIFTSWTDGEEMSDADMETLIQGIYEAVNKNENYYLIPVEEIKYADDYYSAAPGLSSYDFMEGIFELEENAEYSENAYYHVEWNESSNTLDVAITSEPPENSPMKDEDVQKAYKHWCNNSASEKEMNLLLKALQTDIEANPCNQLTCGNSDEFDSINEMDYTGEYYDEDRIKDFFTDIEQMLRYTTFYESAENYEITWDEEEDVINIHLLTDSES